MHQHHWMLYCWLNAVWIIFLVCPPVAAMENSVSISAGASMQITDDAPRLVLEAGGHLAVIRTLLFTADGSELISAGDDKTIRVWSVAPDGRKAVLSRTIRGQI